MHGAIFCHAGIYTCILKIKVLQGEFELLFSARMILHDFFTGGNNMIQI